MSGYENLHQRLNFNGGQYQQDRMILDRLRSLQRAITRSYQTGTIFLQDSPIDNDFKRGFKALINPDKLKNDYDQKYLSIPYKAIQVNADRKGTTTQGEVETGIKAGDVFYWQETDSYWIVYLQFKEELAYFRADIRQCEKEVEVNGHTYHIYWKGPDETSIQWNQKDLIEWNDLNYSAEFYITKTDETLAYFHRFTKVLIDGEQWEVAAVDSAGGDGIIEVALIEDFNNTIEREQNIVNQQQRNEIEQEREESRKQGNPAIIGDDIAYPYDIKYYSIENAGGGTWKLNTKKAKINLIDSNKVKIEIITGKSGYFTLEYVIDGEVVAALPITIESL